MHFQHNSVPSEEFPNIFARMIKQANEEKNQFFEGREDVIFEIKPCVFFFLICIKLFNQFNTLVLRAFSPLM